MGARATVAFVAAGEGAGQSLDEAQVGPLAPGEDLRARLEAAEAAVRRLEGERDRLESMVVRLGALAAQRDADELVRGVTEVARDLTGATVAMFVPAERLAPMGTTMVVCGAEQVGQVPEPARTALLSGALWRVTPLRLDDTSSAEAGAGPQAGYGSLADGRPLRSWVGVPVRARHGEALGALFLAQHQPHGFGRREEELAQGLAGHLGASLDNVVLFQERSRVARALQETLLPPVLPKIPSLDVAARYRPARATAFVGGDFYDLFEARPGVWSLVIGDVSGVGPEAAALTGVARYAVRALASELRSPARVLSRLNETLLGFDLQEKFCTVLYGELRGSAAGLELKLANGGHPFPVVVRADGSVAELEVRGTMLGVLPGAALDEHVVTLAPGELLVTYTDGVPEARGPDGSFFGTEGLCRALQSAAGHPAASVVATIELAVVEHLSGMPSDDMAIVVLGVEPGRDGADGGRPGRRWRGLQARAFRRRQPA